MNAPHEPDPVVESHMRSVAKGASYRVIATLSTLAISFAMTGSVRIATLIGSSEAVAKILLYWAHERIWHRVPWGRRARQFQLRAPVEVAQAQLNDESRRRWIRAAR